MPPHQAGSSANPPSDQGPRVSVLLNPPHQANYQPLHPHAGFSSAHPIPQAGESHIPPEVLSHLLQEEIRRTGVENMDGELLRVLLMSGLASKTNQKLEAGPTLSMVSNQLKWQQLGGELRPQLLLDGSNFPHWLASLLDVISSVTHNTKYFHVDLSSINHSTSNGILAVIKFSIDPALSSLLNGMTAYGAYHSLKGRFANPSWLLLLNRWSDVARAPDSSDSISASYESLKMSLLDLEERLGGWTIDKFLSLSFHSTLKRYHQQIADAIDSRLAIIPSLPVSSIDILNTATRLHQSTTSAANSQPASAMAMATQRGRGGEICFRLSWLRFWSGCSLWIASSSLISSTLEPSRGRMGEKEHHF
jgi:hypothetical protein